MMTTQASVNPPATVTGSKCPRATSLVRCSSRGHSSAFPSGVPHKRSCSTRHCRIALAAAYTPNVTTMGSNTPTRGMSTSNNFAKLAAMPVAVGNPITATNVPNKNDCDTTSQFVRCPMRSSSCWICDAIMVSFVTSSSSVMVTGSVDRSSQERHSSDGRSTRAPRTGALARSGRLLARAALCRLHLPLEFGFEGFEVEARPLLHRRELEEGLRGLGDLLLGVDEAPELVGEPVVVSDRPVVLAVVHAGPLERIEAEIDQDRPVHPHCRAQPSGGLIGKAIFVVLDPHGAQRAFREVEDLAALRGTFAGDEIRLVVAIQVHLVSGSAELRALLEIVDDVGVARRGHEGGQPIEPRDDAVLDPARGNTARPADDARHPEAPFEPRALAACERRLASVRPRKVLGAVVGAEGDDGVVIEAVILHVLHDGADDVVELRHAGFLDGPAILRRAHVLVLVREVRDDVHARRVQPQEERLAVRPRLVYELERVGEDLVVHGLHAIRTQRTRVLDPLLADLAPARLLGGIVHGGGPAMHHVARTH